MNFEAFKSILPKIKKIPLAGMEAHLEMIPSTRKKKDLSLEEIRERNPNNSAVMALFYPGKNNETYFVLILRNTYDGVHSGQIGFPGGQEEKIDADIKATALRETEEEIGVPASKIKIVRPMTKTFIPPSNFWVFPFMGIYNSTPSFKRQESEVQKIIEVQLSDFLDDENNVSSTISTSYGLFENVPAFLLNNQIVWGATAMMLNEVKTLFKKAL